MALLAPQYVLSRCFIRLGRIVACRHKSDWLQVSTDNNTGVATCSMNKPPVNSFTAEFGGLLADTVRHLASDGHTRGIIFTSSLTNVFSAGIHLTEFVDASVDDVEKLVASLEDTWGALYCCPLPVIAAINGHAPAGGTLYCTAADYRIMATGDFQLGYRGTDLGIPPMGDWMTQVLVDIAGRRGGELMLLKSQLMTSEAGRRVGLVDRLVAPEQLMEEARREMDRWLAVPDEARRQTKATLRRAAAGTLGGAAGGESRRRAHAAVAATATSPAFQRRVQAYLSNIKTRKTTS